MIRHDRQGVGAFRAAMASLGVAVGAVAEPLTSPSQLSAGNSLINFTGRATGPIGVAPTIQCVGFSSPQGMSIVDLSSQPYVGPLVGGAAIHPLPGPIGSGLYINTSIVFNPPGSEVGLGCWDPNVVGGLLRVFDANSLLLEQIAVPVQPAGGAGASFVGIRRPTREISLAIFFPGASTDTYALDNISFGPACYVNCDCSTASPALSANDFSCFLNRFVEGDPYANCDGSTLQPLLTANDFSCFLTAYVTGCS
jgi:hypothetical protein